MVALIVVASGAQALANTSNVNKYIQEKYRIEFVRTEPKVTVQKMAELITHKAVKHGIDPMFLASLVWHESNFRPDSVSGCGALGLGQIMPVHWRAHGFSIRKWKDPATNLELTCRVYAGFESGVRRTYQKLSEEEVRSRALVAYNMGFNGMVSRGLSRSRYSIAILGDIRPKR